MSGKRKWYTLNLKSKINLLNNKKLCHLITKKLCKKFKCRKTQEYIKRRKH